MRQKALQFFIRLNLALLVFARFSQIPADLKLEEEWSVTPSIKEDDFEEHFFNSFHQSKHQFAPVEEFENPKLDNDSNLELTEWTPVEESELHHLLFQNHKAKNLPFKRNLHEVLERDLLTQLQATKRFLKKKIQLDWW